MNITIIDPILCKTDRPDILRPLLTYKKEFWRRSKYSKERTEYDAKLVSTRGEFLRGFLPRVVEELNARKIPFNLFGDPADTLSYENNTIEGYVLRPDQQNLVNKSCAIQRGILIAPTRSGKTIVLGHIAKNLKEHKGLFICNSISLVTQAHEDFCAMKLLASKFHGANKDLDGNLVVSTIGTISSIAIEKICDMFDYIFIDEAHHCSTFTGQYYKFLTSILAPMRIGVTATDHIKGSEKSMAMEGLLGPVIGVFTMEEAQKAGVLAKPKMKLISVPKNSNIQELRTYSDIYKTGIVNNRVRNKSIAELALKIKQEQKTFLIYIKQTEHIKKIINEFNDSIKFRVVEGETPSDIREDTKKLLTKKELDGVIASDAWKEGITIPTIDYIIFAGSGKSEIAVLQTMGRGLGLAPGKEEVCLVDFLDEGKYLSEHLAARLNIYVRNGWL